MVINTLQYDARYTQRHINTLQYDARYTQRHINTLQYDARYICQIQVTDVFSTASQTSLVSDIHLRLVEVVWRTASTQTKNWYENSQEKKTDFGE